MNDDMYSGAGFGNQGDKQPMRREYTTLKTIDPTQGMQPLWIDNHLSSKDTFTTLRFLPSFTADGEERPAIKTAGNPDQLTSYLTSAFAQVELCRIATPGVVHTFISSVKRQDRKGQDVPPAKMSIAENILFAIDWQIRAQDILTEKGYELRIPEEWLSKVMRMKVERRPQPVLLVQCIADCIDGKAVRSAGGGQGWQYGVFPIGASLTQGLLKTLTTTIDPSKPITPDNVPAHCDYFSLARGMHLKFYRSEEALDPDKVQRNSRFKTKTTYGIQPMVSRPLPADAIRKMVQPWQSIINEPTVEEAIEFMIKLFSPEIVDYGLSRSPWEDYLPADIRGSSRGIYRETRNKATLMALPPNPNRASNTVQVPAGVPRQPQQQQAQTVAGGMTLPATPIASVPAQPDPAVQRAAQAAPPLAFGVVPPTMQQGTQILSGPAVNPDALRPAPQTMTETPAPATKPGVDPNRFQEALKGLSGLSL